MYWIFRRESHESDCCAAHADTEKYSNGRNIDLDRDHRKGHRLNPQDIQKMLGHAHEMQQQMEQRLSSTVVEATSGGGAVTVKMNGKKQVLSLKIDPTAVSSLIGSANTADVEMLEDLIVAALNEAGRRADESLQSGISGMLGGLNLPGF
jgi:hypothetical protein